MIVSGSLKALGRYEKIFNIEPVGVTDFAAGENEVLFSSYGVRFHLLDEVPRLERIAPGAGDPMPGKEVLHV